MIRTRDFALFLLAVLLLVANISITAVRDFRAEGQQAAVLGVDAPLQTPEVGELSAELATPTEPDRTSRLAMMREKVAAHLQMFMSTAPSPVAESPAPETVPSAEDTSSSSDNLLTCPSYAVVSWPSFVGAQFKEVEGARMVYREAPALAVTGAASGTEPLVSGMTVLAQLPLYTIPQATPACLPQDVVGIAIDGSLIRNDEVALYTVFDATTLVGYALDGFPIYGTSNKKTDRCGGVVENSWYRYYLSETRETILNCFAGAPVSL